MEERSLSLRLEERYPGLDGILDDLPLALEVNDFVFVNEHQGTVLRASRSSSSGQDGQACRHQANLLTDILVEYGKTVVSIDCLLGQLGAQNLFDRMVDAVAQWTPGPRNDYVHWNGHKIKEDDGLDATLGSREHWPVCKRERTDMDGCDGLLSRLKLAVRSRKEQSRLHIVFERAEWLRDGAESVMVVLARLSELTGLNICSIFISSLDWSTFRPRLGGWTEPYKVVLPQVTKPVFLTIGLGDLAAETHADPIKIVFVEALYDTFWRHSRSLIQMRDWLIALWPAFVQPLQDDGGKDAAKLVSLAKADWANRLDSINNAHMVEHHVSPTLGQATTRIEPRAPAPKTTIPELSIFGRYLLIAAYLASYNLPRTDIAIFSRTEQRRFRKRRKRRQLNGAGPSSLKMSQQLLGPKIFPLERLIAIYFSILPTKDVTYGSEDEVVETLYDTFFQQLSQLCAFRLVQRITSMDRLELVRFRISLRYPVVKDMCSSLGFHLDDWLYQP